MAFPIRDANPTERFPLVTKALVLLNALVFIYELTNPRVIYEYSLVPALALRLDEAYRWVTHMFLHGGVLHIVGNMWFLWIFGDNVEDYYGRLRFLILYLAWGLAAAFTQFMVTIAQVAQVGHVDLLKVPMLGASGAVSGVLGAYLVLYPRAKIDTLVLTPFITIIELPAVLYLGLWFLYQFLYGSLELAVSTILGTPVMGGVAYWAHIGGFLGGLITGLVTRSRRRRASSWWYYWP